MSSLILRKQANKRRAKSRQNKILNAGLQRTSTGSGLASLVMRINTCLSLASWPTVTMPTLYPQLTKKGPACLPGPLCFASWWLLTPPADPATLPTSGDAQPSSLPSQAFLATIRASSKSCNTRCTGSCRRARKCKNRRFFEHPDGNVFCSLVCENHWLFTNRRATVPGPADCPGPSPSRRRRLNRQTPHGGAVSR